jgi:hypothetical protein
MFLHQRSPILVAACFSFFVGCSLLPQSGDHWYDQLEPDSPCYQVNLLNGLDETSTTEVDDLFDCLNYHQHLVALQATKDALSIGSRSSDPGAIEFARAVNAVELDLVDLVETSLSLLDDPDIPTDTLLDISLELLYGSPASEVRGANFGLDSPTQLERGLVMPLEELVPTTATTLLDENLISVKWAADILESEETRNWLLFGNKVIEAGLTQDWLWHLGELVEASQNSANDRWSNASGDSIRDLVDALFEGTNPLIDKIEPEVSGILSDSTARRQLPVVLQGLHDDGHLQQLPMELSWMVSVDVHGGALSSSETSALASFIRLLAATNEPMNCSVDWFGIPIFQVNLGNVAVGFLEIIADANPDVAQTSFGLLGDLLAWEILDFGTADVLDYIATSGLCPTLTPQVMEDLQAVDVLYQPEAYNVLSSFIEMMSWLKYAKTNQLYNFADMMTDLNDFDGIAPGEELIRDVGTQPLMSDIIDFLPVLIDPAGSDIEDSSVEFDDLVGLMLAAIDPSDGWQQADDLIHALRKSAATWDLLHRSAALLVDDDAIFRDLTDLVPSLVALDPELRLLESLSAQLRNEDLIRPALRLAEIPDLAGRLLSSTASADGQEAPRAFIARLIVDGTVDELLRIMERLLDQTKILVETITEETP